MASHPVKKDIITTLIEIKKTIPKIPDKTDADLNYIKQNDVLTNIPNLNGSMTTISNQYEDFSTSLIQNNVVSTISNNTLKNEATVPRSNNTTTTASIISTKIKTSSLVTQDNFGKSMLILLGFSNMIINKFRLIISFYIYFIPAKNYIHSLKIRLCINIQYNSSLRLL